MKKVLFLLIFVNIFSGCNSKKSNAEKVNFPEWNAVIEAFATSPKSIKKKVWTEEDSEEKTLETDSISWEKETDFLEEINPNQSKFIGAFDVEMNKNWKLLTLKPNQKQSLKSLKIFFDDKGRVKSFRAKIDEETKIYHFKKTIEGKIMNGKVKHLEVEAFQKVIFKDSIIVRSEIMPKY